MSKITPCLWFDGNAEEAANFYVTLCRTAGSTMSSARRPKSRRGRKAPS